MTQAGRTLLHDLLNGYQPCEGYPAELSGRIAAIEAEALDPRTLARLWREEEVTDLDVDCPKVDYEATAAAVMDRMGAALHRHWGVHHWGMDGRCIYPGCSFSVSLSPHNREAGE